MRRDSLHVMLGVAVGWVDVSVEVEGRPRRVEAGSLGMGEEHAGRGWQVNRCYAGRGNQMVDHERSRGRLRWAANGAKMAERGSPGCIEMVRAPEVVGGQGPGGTGWMGVAGSDQ